MILISAASRAVFADNGNSAEKPPRSLMEWKGRHNGSHTTLRHSGLLEQPDQLGKSHVSLQPWRSQPPEQPRRSLFGASIPSRARPAQKPSGCSRVSPAQACPRTAVPHSSGDKDDEGEDDNYAFEEDGDHDLLLPDLQASGWGWSTYLERYL